MNVDMAAVSPQAHWKFVSRYWQFMERMSLHMTKAIPTYTLVEVALIFRDRDCDCGCNRDRVEYYQIQKRYYRPEPGQPK